MRTSDSKTMKRKPISILHIMQGTFAHGGTPLKLLSLVAHGDRDKFRHIFLLFANSAKNAFIEKC